MARQPRHSTQVEKDLYGRHANFCKVLSHPTRLQIIDNALFKRMDRTHAFQEK